MDENSEGYRMCYCGILCPTPRLVSATTWYRHNPIEDRPYRASYTPRTSALVGFLSPVNINGKRPISTSSQDEYTQPSEGSCPKRKRNNIELCQDTVTTVSIQFSIIVHPLTHHRGWVIDKIPFVSNCKRGS